MLSSRLSGIIDVESEPGLGTRLTLTLPITLAIIQALIIRAAGRTFAVPLNSVLESLRVMQKDVRLIERREVMSLRGQTLPLARLERMFRLECDNLEGVPHKQFVVVVGLNTGIACDLPAQPPLGMCQRGLAMPQLWVRFVPPVEHDDLVLALQ